MRGNIGEKNRRKNVIPIEIVVTGIKRFSLSAPKKRGNQLWKGNKPRKEKSEMIRHAAAKYPISVEGGDEMTPYKRLELPCDSVKRHSEEIAIKRKTKYAWFLSVVRGSPLDLFVSRIISHETSPLVRSTTTINEITEDTRNIPRQSA
jgi:hypothetical protein